MYRRFEAFQMPPLEYVIRARKNCSANRKFPDYIALAGPRGLREEFQESGCEFILTLKLV